MSAKVLPQYFASMCICIGSFGLGTVLGWSSNITDDLKGGKLNGIEMGNDELGWAGSCCTLGAMVMCFPIGVIADWIGRKATALLTAIPFIIGWLIILFAQNVYMLYVGRVLTGAAGGSFVVTAPLYTTEISQTHIRGTLGSFMQFFLVIGVLSASLLGWLLPLTLFHVYGLSIPVLFAILFFFQPETPFYYINKENTEAAAKSFARLRGNDYDYKEEQTLMTQTIESRRQFSDFKTAIKTKSARKSAIVCFSLMFFQQMSGINAILFYAKDIFIQSGAGIEPHFSVICMGFTGLTAITIGVWTTDYFGRTILLMASFAGCSIATFFLALFFSLKENLDEDAIKKYGFWPITCVLLYVFAFQLGLGALPWLACSEIFSPELKAKLGAPAGTLNYLTAFMVTKGFYPVSEAIGVDVAFYIFALVSLIGFLFTLFIIPETKNKTYDEIVPDLEKFWKF